MIQELNGIANLEECNNKNQKFERASFSVPGAENRIEVSHNTDSLTKKIVGIAVTTDDEDAFLASTISINIKGQEIFPTNFEARMLHTGQEVAPNKKYFIFNAPIDVSRDEIRIVYTDGDNFTTAYNVTVILMCFE